MTNVHVVTDSSAQLTADEIKENNIKIVPLDIVIDGEEYIDGVDITRDEFISKMKASSVLPTTSQPSLGVYTQTYENILNEDPDATILSIHMSRSLSGTVETARQAADIVAAEKIVVIDSEFTDWGLSFQVLKAVELAKEGYEIEQILPELDKVRNLTQLHMGVTSIENMLKGGRLGKWAATISGLLNINIVLNLINNKLSVVKKGRGKKTIDKYMQTVYQIIEEKKDTISKIGISDCDAKEYCKEIKNKILEVAPNLNVEIRTTSPVISTHAGVGAFALIFY